MFPEQGVTHHPGTNTPTTESDPWNRLSNSQAGSSRITLWLKGSGRICGQNVICLKGLLTFV